MEDRRLLCPVFINEGRQVLRLSPERHPSHCDAKYGSKPPYRIRGKERLRRVKSSSSHLWPMKSQN